MIKKSISDILNEFDFTDSIIIDIKTSDFLTDLILEIDYYWDLQEGKDETRIIMLKCLNCKSIIFRIPQIAIEAMNNGDNIDSYFTIVKLIQEDENTVAIFNGIGDEPLLRVEFESLELSVK